MIIFKGIFKVIIVTTFMFLFSFVWSSFIRNSLKNWFFICNNTIICFVEIIIDSFMIVRRASFFFKLLFSQMISVLFIM